MLDDNQITALVRRFYSSELEEENQLRLTSSVRFDEPNREAAVAYYERLGSEVRAALARNELGRADEWVHALLDREGRDHDLDHLSRAKLQQGVLRASCDVAEALRKRFEGEFHHQPVDPLLVPEADAMAAAAPEPAPPPELPIPTGPLFSERAESYRQKRLRLGTWDAQTAFQARKTFALFAEICGDRPVGGYVRADAVRFKDLLVELPANYGKAARYRGMKAVDIARAAASESEPRLASRTVQRHLSALACLWDEAVEAGEAQATIFGNFKLPSGKRAKDQRDMWETEQLAQLFDSPVWHGCFSDARRSKAGDLVIRDEKFWLPLIAVFSGMRQEEICQLYLEDVRQDGDIWLFDINDRPPRQLKNRNAVRKVPIHRQLLGLGLLEYVEEIRRSGAERLFPQLQPGGADRRFGHNFTKWFTRYRRDVGLYRKHLDFHSFRHSATTFLLHAGVEPIIVDALTGHETAGETARYTKYFATEQLKEAIDRIDPRVDLRHLQRA